MAKGFKRDGRPHSFSPSIFLPLAGGLLAERQEKMSRLWRVRIVFLSALMRCQVFSMPWLYTTGAKRPQKSLRRPLGRRSEFSSTRVTPKACPIFPQGLTVLTVLTVLLFQPKNVKFINVIATLRGAKSAVRGAKSAVRGAK
jgi:hypothetical protein